jgi:DNA polymerase-3 subunit chi
MTEVAFHFNVPDKMNYVCRLLRKASQAKARVVVAGPHQALQTLDEALWTFTATSFVAHCWSSDASPKTDLSSVILKNQDNASGDAEMPHHEVLLNLGNTMPLGYETFERVIEVVGLNEEDKSQARERWKQYAQRGYTLVKHDLSDKAAKP